MKNNASFSFPEKVVPIVFIEPMAGQMSKFDYVCHLVEDAIKTMEVVEECYGVNDKSGED